MFKLKNMDVIFFAFSGVFLAFLNFLDSFSFAFIIFLDFIFIRFSEFSGF